MSIDWFALNLFYGGFIHKLYFTIVPMTMESFLHVKENYFSPTSDREVTSDHHQATRREKLQQLVSCKNKTGLSGHSLCLDHVIRQNVSKWSCIGPPNSQKQPKKGTKVKPTSKYDPPYVPLYYIEGFLMLYSMFNFCQNPEGGFDVKLVNSSFI